MSATMAMLSFAEAVHAVVPFGASSMNFASSSCEEDALGNDDHTFGLDEFRHDLFSPPLLATLSRLYCIIRRHSGLSAASLVAKPSSQSTCGSRTW